MKRLLHYVAFIPICIGLFIGCGQNPDTGNPGTVGMRPAITGKLLQSDGASAASGALVTLRPRDAVAPIGGSAKVKVQRFMAQTASDGSFAIDSCPAGIYSIEGTGTDGNAARIDSIIVTDPKITTDLAALPLQATGAVRGAVILASGGDAGNVFILAFGSDRFVQANSDGSFLMSDLPYGNYSLKIVCVLPECGMSQSVSVKVEPGDTAILDTITLAMQEVCVPKNVSLSYDSMRLRVTLHWEACAGAGIKGYNIYRYDRSETNQYPLQPINVNLIGNACLYVDSAIFTDESYVYGVAAVAADNSIGRKAGPLEVTTVFGGYRADTLLKNGVEGVYWDTEDRLMVVSRTFVSGTGKLVLKHYKTNLEFDHDVQIPLLTGYSSYGYKLINDRIYFMTSDTDPDSMPNAQTTSTIHCYSLDGEFQYSIDIQKPVQLGCFEERNDTLFILTDFINFSDTGITDRTIEYAAYDTTGRKLFTIGYPIMHHAANGKMYSFNNTQIIEYSFNPMSSNVILQMSVGDPNKYSYDELDANGGRYILWGILGFCVVSGNGEIHSRICQKDYNAQHLQILGLAAIDTKGRIALIYTGSKSEAVVVLTPR